MSEHTPQYIAAQKTGDLLAAKNTEIAELRAALTDEQRLTAELQEQLEAAQERIDNQNDAIKYHIEKHAQMIKEIAMLRGELGRIYTAGIFRQY
jgi:uncharacterized membrane-anchored protein YhcB (DUF1043 family)